MNKSQIRKKILRIRKQKKIKKFIFNFDLISNILKRKKVVTIGFAYSFQKVKKIPTNNYDIGLDFIITNK